MASFSDSEGREWLIVVNPTTMKRAREQAGVEIGKFLDNDLAAYRAVCEDVERFAAMIYALCEPQIKERGLTPEEFGSLLYADYMQGAADAFERAFLDFYPSQRRKILATLAQKGKEYQAKRDALQLASAEAIDVEAMIRHETSKGSAGKSAGSSGSTPALEASAN